VRTVWIALLVVGCSGSNEASVLRIEPPSVEMIVTPGATPPEVVFHVFAGARDVTADASLKLDGAAIGELDGAAIGELDGATLASDGLTGGAAIVTASFGGSSGVATVTAKVSSQRIANGTSATAPDLFAAADDIAIDASLSPGDGAVLPPDLGRLEVDFAAPDADDLHEIAFSGPYLDVRVYTAGVSGPRHVDLTPLESASIAHTSRGAGVELSVRSLAVAAPVQAHASTAHLAFTDRDLATNFAFGVPAPTPGIAPAWTYDVAAGMATPRKTEAPCVGCHYAASADGRRIAVGLGGMGFGYGAIYDALTFAPLTAFDPNVQWFTATFDPGGRVVSSFAGVLTLRDGASLAAIATLPAAAGATMPTIDPTGKTLVYGIAPDGGPYPDSIPAELVASDWDAATGTLGPPRTLVPPDGVSGVELPVFSDDGRYVLFTRRPSLKDPHAFAGAGIVVANGSGLRAITTDPRDVRFSWASAIAPTMSEGLGPDPMAWLVMNSTRPVGVRDQSGAPQLWLVAWFPERGIATPFHLPGQDPAAGVRHAPQRIATSSGPSH